MHSPFDTEKGTFDRENDPFNQAAVSRGQHSTPLLTTDRRVMNWRARSGRQPASSRPMEVLDVSASIFRAMLRRSS